MKCSSYVFFPVNGHFYLHYVENVKNYCYQNKIFHCFLRVFSRFSHRNFIFVRSEIKLTKKYNKYENIELYLPK